MALQWLSLLFNMNKANKSSEIESWGELTKSQFDKYLKRFSKKFGKPEVSNRLAISFWAPEMNKDLDTRIRITNGQPEIVQKSGWWEEKEQMELTELTFKLPRSAKDVFTVYKIFHNNIFKKSPDKFLQFTNYVFKTPKFEIKLSRQTGKTNKYSFEVELLDKKESLSEVLDNLGLKNLVVKTNVNFWKKWDRDLNPTRKDLTERQIFNLIKKYLS